MRKLHDHLVAVRTNLFTTISDEERRTVLTSKEYSKNRKSDWKSFLFTLNSPIAIATGLMPISLNGYVIYPPFLMKDVHVGEKGILVPLADGTSISPAKHLVYTATAGPPSDSTISGATIARGLRIDSHNTSGKIDPELLEFLDYFKRIVREVTLQWWIGSPLNPFMGEVRHILNIDLNYRPLKLLFQESEKVIVNGWETVTQVPQLAGIEKTLSKDAWQVIYNILSFSAPADQATEFFMNGVLEQVVGDNNKAIYYYCVSLEMMEHKCREYDGKNLTNNYALGLLKSASLWKQEDKALLKKMFTDRGHITHGKKPHYASQSGELLIEYASLVKAYHDEYYPRSLSTRLPLLE